MYLIWNKKFKPNFANSFLFIIVYFVENTFCYLHSTYSALKRRL